MNHINSLGSFQQHENVDKSELEKLREDLKNEREARLSLEDECDLLAKANIDLQDQVTRLTSKLQKYAGIAEAHELELCGSHISLSSSTPTSCNTIATAVDDIMIKLASSCASPPTTRKLLCVNDVCGPANPLCVAFMYLSGQKEIGESVNVHPSSPLPLMLQRVVVVGGADRSVRLYSLHGDGRELARWTLPAPVLSLSTHGSVVCAGCMDGQSVVIDVEAVAAAAAASDKSVEIPVLDLNEECCVEYRLLRRQAKYVICTQFSPDGLLLTTLAHDHSLHVYAAEQAASLSSWTHIATCTLASAADSLAYLPCPGITGLQWWRLVVALRDHTHLHSACLPELPAESTPVLLRMVPFVSLNERVWDTHAGMQPLLLRTSADHLHLAVSTDKSLAFVLDVSYSGATSDAVMASEQEQQRRAQRLYLLSGHSCGSLCRPQLEWDAYGTYLYGSSEGDTAVLVWGVGSGAPQRRVPIARLVGHKGVVRGIATHRSESITVTVAFDHKLIVWGPETDVSV